MVKEDGLLETGAVLIRNWTRPLDAAWDAVRCGTCEASHRVPVTCRIPFTLHCLAPSNSISVSWPAREGFPRGNERSGGGWGEFDW